MTETNFILILMTVAMFVGLLLVFLFWFIRLWTTDPVYSCDFYKTKGCSHIDGMQCDMKTCTILKQYRLDDSNT